MYEVWFVLQLHAALTDRCQVLMSELDELHKTKSSTLQACLESAAKRAKTAV